MENFLRRFPGNEGETQQLPGAKNLLADILKA